MEKQLDIVRKTRKAIINLISDLSTEEINKVPTGFNNNIIWNFAHLIAAQDNMCYVKAGLPLRNIDQDFFDDYKPGSKPEKPVSAEEIDRIKALMFTSLDQVEQDIRNDHFKTYTPWATRYGVEMNSLNDALTLLPFHEGLHFGYIMALKRSIRSQADL